MQVETTSREVIVFAAQLLMSCGGGGFGPTPTPSPSPPAVGGSGTDVLTYHNDNARTGHAQTVTQYEGGDLAWQRADGHAYANLAGPLDDRLADDGGG